ncbi:hypothetical protein AGMMS49982_12320 [Bacteroidia bacterium]|nr:hypothetical protein AGMMS49982_12320 [Bacteroidia bacterium]
MEKIGLGPRIASCMYNIYLGRKGLVTEGGEIEGRLFLKKGLLKALSIFQEVHANVATDVMSVIVAEHAYLTEELQCCDAVETDVIASMTAGIESFNDALRAYEVVQDAVIYKGVEKSYPRNPKYRHKGMPKDAFHIACLAATARLRNSLRTPGINGIERDVYVQRAKDMVAMQDVYWELQQIALG